MKEWIAVLKAADAAARWHVHQRRKGLAEEPYINHLLEVASLVAEATDGQDPDLVIAALLHDAIEDQEVPREIIADIWGEGVVKLVEEVTDDKSLDKAIRKRKQVETTPTKSDRAKVIKLADKTSNLRAIAASPPSDWRLALWSKFTKRPEDRATPSKRTESLCRSSTSTILGDRNAERHGAPAYVRGAAERVPLTLEASKGDLG